MSAPPHFSVRIRFLGVLQVQNGSKPDEPQVGELLWRRSYIKILTKTAANRNVALAIRE